MIYKNCSDRHRRCRAVGRNDQLQQQQQQRQGDRLGCRFVDEGKERKISLKKVPVTSREERLRDALAENRRCESSSLKSPLDLNSFGNCGSIRVTSSLGGNLQNKKN